MAKRKRVEEEYGPESLMVAFRLETQEHIIRNQLRTALQSFGFIKYVGFSEGDDTGFVAYGNLKGASKAKEAIAKRSVNLAGCVLHQVDVTAEMIWEARPRQFHAVARKALDTRAFQHLLDITKDKSIKPVPEGSLFI